MVKAKIVFLLLFVALLVAVGLWLKILATPGIVAQAVLPNGIQIYLVQTFNWNLGERFTTSFYCRATNGVWGWCYYNHQEDWPWRGRVELDHQLKRATIFQRDTPVIIFDWETQTYGRLRQKRTVNGAQPLETPHWRTPGWTPEWWQPPVTNKPLAR